MTLWDKRADIVLHEGEPYNAEPPPAALAGQPLTGIGPFYSRNHGPVPDLDPAWWRLRVAGMVRRALELSLADLQTRFAAHTLTVTLQCAVNQRAGFLEVRDITGEDPWGPGATSTAQWTGVRLGDVLAAAGIDRDAGSCGVCVTPDVSELVEPAQSYGSWIPVAKARSGDVLLAWAMNDVACPRSRGDGAGDCRSLYRCPERQVRAAGHRTVRTVGQLVPSHRPPGATGRRRPGPGGPG